MYRSRSGGEKGRKRNERESTRFASRLFNTCWGWMKMFIKRRSSTRNRWYVWNGEWVRGSFRSYHFLPSSPLFFSPPSPLLLQLFVSLNGLQSICKWFYAGCRNGVGIIYAKSYFGERTDRSTIVKPCAPLSIFEDGSFLADESRSVLIIFRNQTRRVVAPLD